MKAGQYNITALNGELMTVEVVPVYRGIDGEAVCVGCTINGKFRTLEQFEKLKPEKD